MSSSDVTVMPPVRML